MNRKELNSFKQSFYRSLLNESEYPPNELISEPDAPPDPGWENPEGQSPETFDLDLHDRGHGPWDLPQLPAMYQWVWDRSKGQWVVAHDPNYYTRKNPFNRPSPSWEQILNSQNRPQNISDQIFR